MAVAHVLLAWVSALVFAQAPPDSRSPVPEAAAVKDIEKLVRDVYKDEYARRGAADRLALARRLLREAIATKDDAGSRYVLLKEARALALEGADSETALKAVEETSKLYRVDGLGLKQQTLTALATTAKTPAELKTLASALLQLADEALEQNNLDAAEQAAAAAAPAAQRAKEIPMVLKAQVKSKEIRELKSRAEQLKKALDLLAAQPEDGAANLLVGQDLCFSKGKWEEGLPRLAKGNDPVLQALAARDLANPQAPAEQVLVGDGWWNVGEKESGPARVRARQRSVLWYERAVAGTTGLSKLRLEKRIAEVRSADVVDLLKLIDPAQDTLSGPWTVDAKGLHGSATAGTRPQLLVPYLPPQEYDLTMVVQRKSGAHYLILGMMSGDARFSLVLDSWPDKGYVYGLQWVDGKFVIDNESAAKGKHLHVGKPATVTCAVRRTGVSVTVDGKPILNWTAGYDRLSTYAGAPPKGIFFELFESAYVISQLTVTPLSGEGTRTR